MKRERVDDKKQDMISKMDISACVPITSHHVVRHSSAIAFILVRSQRVPDLTNFRSLILRNHDLFRSAYKQVETFSFSLSFCLTFSYCLTLSQMIPSSSPIYKFSSRMEKKEKKSIRKSPRTPPPILRPKPMSEQTALRFVASPFAVPAFLPPACPFYAPFHDIL